MAAILPAFFRAPFPARLATRCASASPFSRRRRAEARLAGLRSAAIALSIWRVTAAAARPRASAAPLVRSLFLVTFRDPVFLAATRLLTGLRAAGIPPTSLARLLLSLFSTPCVAVPGAGALVRKPPVSSRPPGPALGVEHPGRPDRHAGGRHPNAQQRTNRISLYLALGGGFEAASWQTPHRGAQRMHPVHDFLHRQRDASRLICNPLPRNGSSQDRDPDEHVALALWGNCLAPWGNCSGLVGNGKCLDRRLSKGT
jgi:hypothetical protein